MDANNDPDQRPPKSQLEISPARRIARSNTGKRSLRFGTTENIAAVAVSRKFFSLNRVPKEVREKIYHHLWTSSTLEFRHGIMRICAVYPGPPPWLLSGLPLWLRTNKVIFQEGMDQLYRCAIFSPKPYTPEIPFYEDSVHVKHESALSLHCARTICLTSFITSYLQTGSASIYVEQDPHTNENAQVFTVNPKTDMLFKATTRNLKSAVDLKELRLTFSFNSALDMEEATNYPFDVISGIAYLDRLPKGLAKVSMNLNLRGRLANERKDVIDHVVGAIKDELERIAVTLVDDSESKVENHMSCFHSSKSLCKPDCRLPTWHLNVTSEVHRRAVAHNKTY